MLRKEQATIRVALKTIAEVGGARVAATEQAAKAAIAVSRDQAVRSLQAVQSTLTKAIQDADGRVAAVVERYRALAEEAGKLEAQVAFRRALASDDAEAWRSVRPAEWAAVLRHLGRWLGATEADPAAPGVDVLAPDIANRLRYGSLYLRVTSAVGCRRLASRRPAAPWCGLRTCAGAVIASTSGSGFLPRPPHVRGRGSPCRCAGVHHANPPGASLTANRKIRPKARTVSHRFGGSGCAGARRRLMPLVNIRPTPPSRV